MQQRIFSTAIIDLSVYALLGLLYCIGFFDVTPTKETLAVVTFAMQRDDNMCGLFRSTVLSTNYDVYNYVNDINTPNLLAHISYENIIINPGKYDSSMSLAVLSLLLRGGCDFISLLILSWSEWVKYGKGQRHKAHIHVLIGHRRCNRHKEAYRTKLKILHHIIRVEQLILVWLSASSVLMIFLLVTQWNSMTAGSTGTTGIATVSSGGNGNTTIKVIDLDLVDMVFAPISRFTSGPTSASNYTNYDTKYDTRHYHSSSVMKYRVTLTYEDNPVKFLAVVSILFMMHLMILLLLHSRKRHEQKTYAQHIEFFDHDAHYYRKHLLTTLLIHFVAFVGTLVAYLLGDLSVLLQAEQSLTIIVICTYLLDVVVGLLRLFQVYRKREKTKTAWRRELQQMVGLGVCELQEGLNAGLNEGKLETAAKGGTEIEVETERDIGRERERERQSRADSITVREASAGLGEHEYDSLIVS